MPAKAAKAPRRSQGCPPRCSRWPAATLRHATLPQKEDSRVGGGLSQNGIKPATSKSQLRVLQKSHASFSFTEIYSDILSGVLLCPAFYLTFNLAFYLKWILEYIQTFDLILYLLCILTFYPNFYLTFHLKYVLIIC
jgi:hypothetical protein